MSWPVTTGVPIKVIIMRWSIKWRSSRFPLHFIWNHSTTSCRHVLYVLTAYWSFFLSDYTSGTWLTNYPIVYVGFDHEILSNVLPVIPVNSPKWWITEWRDGWDLNVSADGRPVWTGGDGIACWVKTAVIFKGVAVNQGPASPVSFHVTVNLKGFISSELDPVSSWGRGRVFG